MTDQEQNHDMQRSDQIMQTGSPLSTADGLQEREETGNASSAGIIAHRDQFSEPEPPDESETVSPTEFSERLNSLRQTLASRKASPRAVHCSPPAARSKMKYQTLFLLSGYSIKAGLHGGLVLCGTTVFGKKIEILVREIKSIEPIFDFSDSLLEQVSLRETAEKLFVTCENSPYDPRIVAFWPVYLQDVAIPMIENMIEHWIAASSAGISNPVTEYFYGHNGILRQQLDRESIVKRINSSTANPVVPLLTRYKGPALVIVYEE